jgi:hypothetical protein
MAWVAQLAFRRGRRNVELGRNPHPPFGFRATHAI